VLFAQVDKATADRTLAAGRKLSAVSKWHALGAELVAVGALGPNAGWSAQSKSSYRNALLKIWRSCRVLGLNPG
jgi:hypothetical protein